MATPCSDQVFGFVALELATEDLLVAQRLHGGIGLRAVGHVNEAEALGLVVVAVGDDSGGIHLAVSLELLAKLVFGEIVAEIADVNFDRSVGGGRNR